VRGLGVDAMSCVGSGGKEAGGCADERCLWVAQIICFVVVVYGDDSEMEPCVVCKRISVPLMYVSSANSNHSQLWKKEVRHDDACPLCEARERRMVLSTTIIMD